MGIDDSLRGSIVDRLGSRWLSPTNIIGLHNTCVSSFHAALLVCATFAALGIVTVLSRGNETAVKKAK